MLCRRLISRIRDNFSEVCSALGRICSYFWRCNAIDPGRGNRVMRSLQGRSIVMQRTDAPNVLRVLASAFAEGFSQEQRDETLSSWSEHDLAAVRLSHQDLARFVMFGR